MPIVPILVVVLLVAGIIALVMSGKNWRWYHITLTAFIMLFTIVWFYMAARVLQIQKSWREEVGRYQTELAKEAALEKTIKDGVEDAEGKPHLPLAEVKNEVAKLLQGRGRVWDKVVRSGIDPNTGVINATVANPEGLEKNLVVWVFDEGPASAGNRVLGSFQVTEVNGNAVKLTPSLKLRADALQLNARPKSTPLVIKELMPTDSPELNDELVKAFPASVPAAVKAEFQKDGKPPEANERNVGRIWQRVKALKDISVPLNSDEAKELQARATQDPPLETDVAKNELKIPAGEILLLDPRTAKQRIDAGEVEPAPAEEGGSDKVYVRELRDYAQLWRSLNLQIESVLRSKAEIDGQIATVAAAQTKVDKDLAVRAQEKTALKADQTHFLADLEVIKAHRVALEKSVAELKQQVQAKIAENNRLTREIATRVRAAADKINRESATAANPAP